jgi:hypothetical protein
MGESQVQSLCFLSYPCVAANAVAAAVSGKTRGKPEEEVTISMALQFL